MAENEDDRMDELSVSDVSSEIQKILDKVFDNLKERDADRSALPDKLPELFPNGVTNINIELSLNSASAAPGFSAKLQISGPPDKALSDAPEADTSPDAQERVAPVRFRIRRHRNATPALTNARANRILSDGAQLLRTVDGAGDVRCNVDLGLDGSVETFSVGNGIISSEADYDAVCNESTHPNRIYIVNQILFCGGSSPSPGFVFIGCADTPGDCMILARTEESEEPVLWMHEYGHNRGLDHRDARFAVMHSTIETNHRRVNASERDAYEGRERLMESAQNESPQPTERPENVRDFVHQKFIHGVPYEQARQYSPDVVPQLLEMLEDQREERYWPNIVATICMIGDARAVEPLIRFVRRGEGILSRYEYDAKTIALMNLGYLIRQTGVENAAVAFNYLREGVTPEMWDQEAHWMNPYNLSREEQNVQLAKVAVWGLALTGTPQAAEVLRSVRQVTASAESTTGESQTQPLGDLVEEALRYHASIAD